ncbi:MAG: ABC transporter ATP-binding protein [Candidatus Sumerlaeaceae bacterium]|nr:ABC transporter ATP-binding protein [Candidatus Sumerlaeaceae bacterium]
MNSDTQLKEPILRAELLEKVYHDGDRLLHVLRGASLEVYPGEIVSIVGASGSGKSTLLHLLGALDRVTAGRIVFRGQDYNTMTSAQLAQVRNRSIGFIFQFHHLLAEFSARENVMMPALIAGKNREEVLALADSRLKELGLAERLHHRPTKLSGGEQQRVALARALINDPDLVLADEPTGNLDSESAAAVIDLLWNNVRDNHRALVIVTHDPEIARRADRCFRLRDGRLFPEKTD